MRLAMLILLSVVSIGCVSAGGSWCAKTARARATAMGLDLPKNQFIPYSLQSTPHGSHDPRETHYKNKDGFRVAEQVSPSDWDYGQVFTRGVQPNPSRQNHRASKPQLADSIGNYARRYRDELNGHLPDFSQVKKSPQPEAMVLGPSEYSDRGNGRDYYIPNSLARRRDPVDFQPGSSRQTSSGLYSRLRSGGPFSYGKGLLPVQRQFSPYGPGRSRSIVPGSFPLSETGHFGGVKGRGSADRKTWPPGPVYSRVFAQRPV
ncbi:hypothetical protein DPEC_G00349930 [Dallia pectoralis]|uniref:Uncharacterized protein n=1 Tax=Dallia pectoralis TaxID=75939 RepID=A0ACC2F1Y0_DALPE|nr:hypothetical protein DPEC_G00349930 [Dallia pectoralis]